MIAQQGTITSLSISDFICTPIPVLIVTCVIGVHAHVPFSNKSLPGECLKLSAILSQLQAVPQNKWTLKIKVGGVERLN